MGKDIQKEIEQVHQSLSVINNQAIYCRRIPKPTPFQVNYSIQTAVKMGKEEQVFYYMFDTRETPVPDAANREEIRKGLQFLLSHFKHLVVITDHSPQYQSSIQFITQPIINKPVISFVHSTEEGIERIKALSQNE